MKGESIAPVCALAGDQQIVHSNYLHTVDDCAEQTNGADAKARLIRTVIPSLQIGSYEKLW